MQLPNAKSSDQNTLDREALRAVGHALVKYFPQPITETKLVLMEISPHQLHAYWHITAWDLEAAMHQVADEAATLVLRFHDLSAEQPRQEPPPSFDIEISNASGRQYVELQEDARRYAAELGIRTREGLLIDLARSNTVELPRAGYAAAPGAGALTLTPHGDLFYQPDSAGPAPTGEEDGQQRQSWQADDSQPYDLTLTGKPAQLKALFPDPCQPAADATGTGPLLSSLPENRTDTKGSKTDNATGIEAVSTPVGVPEEGGKAPNIDQSLRYSIAETDAGKESHANCVQPLPSLAGTVPAIPSEYGSTEGVEGGNRDSTRSAIPQEKDANATRTSGPYPVSSFSMAHGQDDNLQVDLLIRGQGRPNSQLVIHGYAIPTGDDGSFTLQQRLPNSMLEDIARLLIASREK